MECNRYSYLLSFVDQNYLTDAYQCSVCICGNYMHLLPSRPSITLLNECGDKCQQCSYRVEGLLFI